MNYKNLTPIINFIFLLSLLLFFSNCYNKIEESDLLHKSNPDGWYGSSFTITVKNKIDNLLNSPEEYLGKEVLVTGEITEICPMRGCWIDIKDPESESNIRVKVTDGEIVFPLSANGKYVDVQGTFTKINFTEEQAKKWKIHLAEEQGIHLIPDEVEIKPEDLVEYRINGKGANIYTYGCK